ncbi:MAG: ATP-binding protein [Bacteroidota bacterium]|nr:ATP-binding protein [Bacteroidota bacterium]
MNSAIITRPVTKKRGYPHSSNTSRSLSKTIPEQPGQFFPALAHEIRNPLSSIKLAAQMLKSIVSDDYQKIYLDIILRGSVRINDIVTDILTSLRAGELRPEKHSIHQLLDETLAMAQDRLLLKNVTVRKEYAAQDRKMVMNGPKMKIALTNIIINAIDAMPPEKGQLILVTKSMNGKYVVEIGDNGTGISKENLENIFKPYFTNKAGGMGIGLSATLDILHSNHARVEVESEEGRGTRFILSFGGKSISSFPGTNQPGLCCKIVIASKGN